MNLCQSRNDKNKTCEKKYIFRHIFLFMCWLRVVGDSCVTCVPGRSRREEHSITIGLEMNVALLTKGGLK